uniref:Uncharacterized protein n=1 Tax=Timspurckia oligopyrenoides TaxID=708627 RepID=A0A7S1ET39_9RHOD|mmetsp:Transcript_5879/g.10426  ORF Transcript_5879/g.10426 Transcript_5879/m.10426 type:complete len:686 (+) Transcript_5879:80-2137(+)
MLGFIWFCSPGKTQILGLNSVGLCVNRCYNPLCVRTKSRRFVMMAGDSSKDQVSPFGEPDDWMKEFVKDLGPVYPVAEENTDDVGPKWTMVEGTMESDEETKSGWEAWNSALQKEAEMEEFIEERDAKAEVDMWRSTARELGSTESVSSAERLSAADSTRFEKNSSSNEDLGGVPNFPDIDDILAGKYGETKRLDEFALESEFSSSDLWQAARDVTSQSKNLEDRLRDEVTNYDPTEKSSDYLSAAREILGDPKSTGNVPSPPSEWNPSRDWSRFDDVSRQNKLNAEKNRRKETEDSLRRKMSTDSSVEYVDSDGNVLSQDEVDAAFADGALFVDEITGENVDLNDLHGSSEVFDGYDDQTSSSDLVTAQDVLEKSLENNFNLQEEPEQAVSSIPAPAASFIQRLSKRDFGSTYGADSPGQIFSAEELEKEGLLPRDPLSERDFWKSSAKEIIAEVTGVKNDNVAEHEEKEKSTEFKTEDIEDESDNSSAWASWTNASQEWTRSIENGAQRDPKAEIDQWRSSAREVTASSGTQTGFSVNSSGEDWGAGLNPRSERSAWENWNDLSSPTSSLGGSTISPNLWFSNRPDTAKSMYSNPDVSESAKPEFWRDIARDLSSSESSSSTMHSDSITDQVQSDITEEEATDDNDTVAFWRSFAKDMSPPPNSPDLSATEPESNSNNESKSD